MQYTIQMLDWFRDGNVYPERLRPGQIVRVDELTYLKMVASTPGCCEVLGKEVPKSSVRKPQPKTQKKNKESNDKED